MNKKEKAAIVKDLLLKAKNSSDFDVFTDLMDRVRDEILSSGYPGGRLTLIKQVISTFSDDYAIYYNNKKSGKEVDEDYITLSENGLLQLLSLSLLKD